MRCNQERLGVDVGGTLSASDERKGPVCVCVC